MIRSLKRLGNATLRRMPLVWSRAIRIRHYTGRWPQVSNPVGLNDKINWRILYDRREIWHWTCDKLLSKEYAVRRSPGILLPDVLWVGTDLRELAELGLEGRWILKANRSSNDVIVGSGAPNIAALAAEVATWNDFQWRDLGEFAYGYAAPVLLLERWLGDTDEPPMDYKIHVYDGVARFVQIHRNRFAGHRASMFTRDWVRIESSQSHAIPDEITLPRPARLDEMLGRAEQIAEGFDYIRVDFFETPEGVWFGETTPYSWSGTRPFSPESVERELGRYWTLPDLSGSQEQGEPVG